MIKKTILGLLLGLAVLLVLPAGVAHGAQDTARVVGYTGEMVMGADGSLAVAEYVTWRVSGTPDMVRRLDISSATAVEDIGVYRVTALDLAAPEEAERTALRRSAGAGADTYDWKFTEEGDSRYLDMTLYPDEADGYLTLVFTYRLTDSAYLYQDGAAFRFNPLWQAGEGSLTAFYMHCRLAEGMEPGAGTARYYANGGLTEDWTGSALYASQVDLESGLEVVAVLPISWVPQGRKTVKNNILPHLDAQQQIYRAQRDEKLAQREKALARSRLTLWVAVGVMAGGILLIFLLYGVRPSRRQQKQFLLPNRHLPGEARLLLRKPLTRRSALAELIYLWHRGFLQIVPGENGEWALKPEKRSDEALSLHEQYLLSWMVHHSGAAAGTIREKLSDPTAFKIWKRLVKKTVGQKDILKEAKAAWVIGLGLGVMEWVLAAMIVVNVNAWDTALLVALMGVLVAGYGCVVKKVTRQEMREAARYRTYARQLRGEKGCAGPWKRQLAYAMVLDADTRILKVLIKEGGSEVSAFASWVKKQRLYLALPFLKRQKTEGTRTKGRLRWPKPFRGKRSARHEAAATDLAKLGKHGEKKYRKPDPDKWPPGGLKKH